MKKQIKQYDKYIVEIEEIPHKYMKCIVGRITINKNEEKERKVPLPPKETKSIDEERERKLENQILRKNKSDLHVKTNLLYLDMLLLIIDSESQIIFTQIERKLIKDESNSNLHFHCSSIISKGKEIYNSKYNYRIEQDEERNFPTIKIDNETGCPIVDERKDIYYNTERQFRIQQHIVIQIINRLLKEKGISIDYTIRKTASRYLSSLIFKTFLDFDENNHFVPFERTLNNNENESIENIMYKELIDSLIEFISYFFDNKIGKSRKVIIGDEKIGINKFTISTEETLIGRQIFITALYINRKMKIPIQMIFEQSEIFLFPYLPINETNNEMKEEK